MSRVFNCLSFFIVFHHFFKVFIHFPLFPWKMIKNCLKIDEKMINSRLLRKQSKMVNVEIFSIFIIFYHFSSFFDSFYSFSSVSLENEKK